MDPYLEAPAEWPSLHHELSSEIARQLAPKLSPKYVARTERRFYTESPADIGISRSLFPEVGIYESTPSPSSIREIAVALAPDQWKSRR